jgi:hypothetical protein
MEIYGYGEDALTLWALKNELPTILDWLDDSSSLSKCKTFFRPSFGRRGGASGSQFGEFDFILLSEQRLYLGESKWRRSSENISNGSLKLRKQQLLRHTMFRFYVQEWAFGNYSTWDEFSISAKEKLEALDIFKPIAVAKRLLTTNLQTVLETVKFQFPSVPPIKNVLLFLHDGTSTKPLPQRAGDDFEVVPIVYPKSDLENFVLL